MNKINFAVLTAAMLLFASCKKDEMETMQTTTQETGMDPNTAARQSVDRFSANAGTLMIRNAENGLPAANAPINFDQGPFITKGLGPDGQLVEYYNFDVMSLQTAPIYVFFHDGASEPIANQLNIVDVIPGSAGYNDFWHVVKVTVPNNYVANTVTSYAEIMTKNYSVEHTNTIVNCPVVPEGSTASKRFGDAPNGLTMGWYQDKIVTYFNFSEAMLSHTSSNLIPLSPIYVTFNINPDQPNGGPASGFVMIPESDQTHNVIFSIPGEADYSPLWSVSVYDNSDFSSVMCAMSAANSNVLALDVMAVNCPVVDVQ
jgi:hypothetical protein